MSSPTKFSMNKFAQTKTWVIAQQEIKNRLKNRSFVAVSAIMVVLVIGVSLIPGIISLFQPKTDGSTTEGSQLKIAVVRESLNPQSLDRRYEISGPDSESSEDIKPYLEEQPYFENIIYRRYEVTPVATVETAKELVDTKAVDAAVIAGFSANDPVRIIAYDEAPKELVESLTLQPQVQLLHIRSGLDWNVILIGVIIGALFMMLVSNFGTPVAQSVVQEKSGRIIEILLAVVRPQELLAGKIIGNTVLAFGLLIIMMIGSSLALVLSGQTAFFNLLFLPMLWSLPYMLLGFLLTMALYAGLGSLASRQEDLSNTLGLAVIISMIPYFAAFLVQGNEGLLTLLSYVPIASVTLMPMRVYMGVAQWWEPVASFGITILATIGILYLGAFIYKRSVMKVGGKLKLSEVLFPRKK